VPAKLKKEPAGELTTHTGNVETAAFQAALVGFVYVVTYFLVRALGGLLAPDKGKVLWGFFFFFGLGVALIVRFLMKKTGVARLIDPGVQKRITGWSIDFMIVATVVAIQVLVVYEFLLPIFLVSMAAGFVTFFVVLFLGRRLWSYNFERIAAIYGTVTGTCSTGLLLLRVVDPEFKNPRRHRARGHERVLHTCHRGLHRSPERTPLVELERRLHRSRLCRRRGRG
jgi:ESS family glutamate:Na+ symporter